MTGAAAANPLKRKRESEPAAAGPATAGKDYFFAKFLTSPDLLDLEVCPHPSHLEYNLMSRPDRRYPLSEAVPVPAARVTPPSANVHEGGQGDLDRVAESLAPNGIYPRRRRHSVGF